MEDALAAVDAALPCAASGSGAQAAAAKAAAAPGAVAASLLTDGAHAAYAAAASGAERAELARQADAMLEGAGGAPALAEQPPGVLRSHWLLRLQLQWEAAEPGSGLEQLELLARRREQRRCAGRGAESEGCAVAPLGVTAAGGC